MFSVKICLSLSKDSFEAARWRRRPFGFGSVEGRWDLLAEERAGEGAEETKGGSSGMASNLTGLPLSKSSMALSTCGDS